MNRYFEGDEHAKLYKLYRPKTPSFITKHIVQYVQEKRPTPLQLAIDVGCGSGQNTISLSEYFESVVGMDISIVQVAEILKEPGRPSNVSFKVSSAENLIEVADKSVDLLIGAMCVHWFDLPKFYKEVNRVLAPNGVIVVLGMKTEQLCHPTDQILSESLLELIPKYFKTKLDSYHMPAVKSLLENYVNLDFPFEDTVRVDVEPHVIEVTVSHVIGALTTWSAYQGLHTEKPKEALDLTQELQDRILDLVCIDTEYKKDPSKATVHMKYEYFYLMGRVR